MKTIELTDEEVAMLEEMLTSRKESYEEYLKLGETFISKDFVEYQLELSKSILEKL